MRWTFRVTALGPPTEVTATGRDSEVLLVWSEVAGAESYTVKWSPAAGGPYTVLATGVTEMRFTHEG
ncbi:MAG: hypothetical protein ACK44W_07575, partial [Planctomycetota bacterium]